MTQYDNTNSGALFNNSRKETQNHPDFNGTLNVEGVDYWISGWKKKDRNDNTFVSLSVRPKEQRQEAPQNRPVPQRPQNRPAPSRSANVPSGGGFDDWNDDIPL